MYSLDGIGTTITASGGGLGAQTGLYAIDDRDRRLTPRECWRLQGFPDWAFDRAKATGLSDRQLYKQAGNAVTVNVVKWIGKEWGKMMSDYLKAEIIHSVTNAALLIAWASFVYWRIKNLK